VGEELKNMLYVCPRKLELLASTVVFPAATKGRPSTAFVGNRSIWANIFKAARVSVTNTNGTHAYGASQRVYAKHAVSVCRRYL
jgi:hypothetical protein